MPSRPLSSLCNHGSQSVVASGADKSSPLVVTRQKDSEREKLETRVATNMHFPAESLGKESVSRGKPKIDIVAVVYSCYSNSGCVV